MIEQLVLVRHGETLHNVARITQGWQDSELSERGQAQIAGLAQRVRALGCDALFSSPLNRAMTTALAIHELTGLEIRTLDDLREMNYGEWEGRKFLEIRAEYEEVFRRWNDEPDFPCPEGESHAHVLERMKRAFEAIDASEVKRPIVVSHGTAIRIGTTALLNAPITMSRQLAVDNAAFNLFVWRNERCVLKVWNDTSHWPVKDEG